MDYLSDCCGAPVEVEGGVTQFWRCTRCLRPCGTVSEKVSDTPVTVQIRDDDRGNFDVRG